MWICISKKIARAGTQIIRQVTNFADDLGESLIEAKKAFLNDKEKNNNNVKSLKIAILGLPNAGKSTLINQLVGRPICAVSKKIHTTRNKAAAICSIDETQLIFLDTPGLVGRGDVKKYNLDVSFLKDAENSMKEADVVGVVQDMTKQYRGTISEKILELLKLARDDTNSILILNKIDTMKNKKQLLDIVKQLTSNKDGPKFSDVFMISALTGNGVDDLRNYFLDSAKDKNWEFSKDAITDQPPAVIIAQIVKSKLLDNLSQELPYKVNVLVEHMDCYEDNSMNVITRVQCPSNRIARLIIGMRGERIKKLAQDSEQELCKVFQTSVKLKIEIPINESAEKKQLRSPF